MPDSLAKFRCFLSTSWLLDPGQTLNLLSSSVLRYNVGIVLEPTTKTRINCTEGHSTAQGTPQVTDKCQPLLQSVILFDSSIQISQTEVRGNFLSASINTLCFGKRLKGRKLCGVEAPWTEMLSSGTSARETDK